MTAILVGMLLRLLQSLLDGSSTLLIGALIAGVFRHMLGAEGTRRIFGDNSLRSLPQSWALGMLLPVCSLGVIPIAHEMRRAGVSTGAILAFALTAPLFNPLSLLYGLTLSTPWIVVAFATASLILVTMLGCGWNLFASKADIVVAETKAIPPGWQRIAGVVVVACEYLSGSIVFYYFIALSGNMLLCLIFPVGSLQTQFGADDVFAPLIMLPLAIPVYATPMTVMAQIGSMFVHGNSVGAAYSLLALGTGVNIGLIAWIARQHGIFRAVALLVVFATSVTVIAYAIERPLRVTSSVDHPHTHAFDIYSAPFDSSMPNVAIAFRRQLEKFAQPHSRVALTVIVVLAAGGVVIRRLSSRIDLEDYLFRSASKHTEKTIRYDWYLPSSVLGVAILAGLVAASIVGCYLYYPPPDVTLEEMSFVRAEAISAAASRDKMTAVRNLERYDELTRRLQVGYYLRHGSLSDFQRAKSRVLRGWLERCKDAVEADQFKEAADMSLSIFRAHDRCREVFK